MPRKGQVTLIGAGPGDPGLLTLRGLEELKRAEVVLYDRLVGPDILALIPPTAHCVDVGKESGRHLLPQEEINALLLQKAREGYRVVRLKGGDPYLFGRGAEELEAIVQEEIPFQVIPGITSALAVPAWAGIPVTHRDYASSVHIITGHGKKHSPPSIPFSELVKLHGTLVFLMGYASLEYICQGLLDAGMDPHMPAAFIQNGTRSHQQKLVATLSRLSQEVQEKGMSSPAVVVVGEVCRLSETLDWVSQQPLWGKTILVTRPLETPCALGDQLKRLGCRVLHTPAIGRNPATTLKLPDNLYEYAWIVFTSVYGVKLFFQELQESRMDIRILAGIRFAAVGSKTRQAVEERGIFVDYMPEVYDAGHLANGLALQMQPGERVLLYRAEAGDKILPHILMEKGIAVEDFSAYHTHLSSMDVEQLEEYLSQSDLITFTSASSVQGLVHALGAKRDFQRYMAVCIGEQTAACARDYGFTVLVSREATFTGMVERILAHFQNK